MTGQDKTTHGMTIQYNIRHDRPDNTKQYKTIQDTTM